MQAMLKTKEAAKTVGLSPYFLYRNANHIPAAHRAGRALRWDVDALRKWMRQEAINQSTREQ